MTEFRLDFNEPPTGASALAIARIRAHADKIHLYPRGLHEEAEAAASRLFGLDSESVILTNGVDEATDLVLLDAREGTCVTPGFNGYWHRAAALSVPMHVLELEEDWELGRSWGQHRGAFLVAQPNNPTGHLFGDGWLESAAAHFDLVVVDETYRSFTTPMQPSALDAGLGNVCVFVSFSKAFALAGLRIGALVGPAAPIARLRARKSFYSVDSLSLHGLLGALSDPGILRATAEHVRVMRPRFAKVLAAASHIVAEVKDTHSNFLVFRPAEPWSARQVCGVLAARGVHVTDCKPFGLPGWVRLSIGEAGALDALASALDEIRVTP